MQILISKGDQRLGPYTPCEVQARLASGNINGSDPGWHEGLTDWQPVASVLANLSATSNQDFVVATKPSGFAWASFIIGMVGIVAWFGSLLFAGLGHVSGASERSLHMMVAGLLVIGSLGINLVGAILGGLACSKRISNKWMAVTGLVVNGVELVGMVFLMVVGILSK